MEPTEGILSASQAPEHQLPCSPFRSLSSRTVWHASGGEQPTSSASFIRLVRGWFPPRSSRTSHGVAACPGPGAVEKHFIDYSELLPDGSSLCRADGCDPGAPNFSPIWARALAKAEMTGIHVHDLRHTGNHLAAISGASTRE